MKSIGNLLFVLFFATIFIACEKDDSDSQASRETEPTEIAQFIWDGLYILLMGKRRACLES